MPHIPIVAIGASAGGVQTLKEFFEHTPPDTGAAYVVILHLSPNHDSQLAQILQHVTQMPVTQVKEKTRIEPAHVYVIPPDQHLTVEDGHIIPSHNLLVEERRAPVDIFFRSIAEVHGSHAVGVILSGTGANGSMGLKRIKENGGGVFVQNPREAEFNEMPRNAIATDLVDAVLNVAEIPARILEYIAALGTVQIPEDAGQREETDQQALREIFTQLRLRTGHDFSNYKRATLMRRIERRISLLGLPAVQDYARHMGGHPEEAHALLKDLLISVTNFYRDKKTWDEIDAAVLPQIFEDKGAENQIRIWVAGCATGEEAYSLAMLCAERTLGSVDAPRVQIFATDIDEAAIATAREGFYTLNDAADVSPERLARFFTKEGEGFRIRREIRETVLFALHNFIKDPPFSRLDLVSCRNVLIYLNRAAQERVMETFHFALKPGGFLYLGTSESVDTAGDLYKIFSREQHIFQTKQVASKPFIVPESVPALRMEPAPTSLQLARTKSANERITYGELHLHLLESYAPPSLVVNADFDIVHLSDRAGRYLQVSGGELTQNVLKLIRDELRLELRSALYQAQQKSVPVTAFSLKVRVDDSTEHINIHVRPVPATDELAKGFLLVVFEPGDMPGFAEPVARTTDEPAARHLEEELARMRIQLRASNEQHEFHAEELKAGNEELQAMNEELRSATEELETSKEELQSINEELNTVNQELKVKVEEASITTSNLRNLIVSTDIGTIFLDRSFRVVLFTPAARAVFNLIPADHGRPLSDITSHFENETLQRDAETVLEKLHTIEREVQTGDGRTFLTRLSPYRTEEDRIQGVVITFLDISERKRGEAALRRSLERNNEILESISDAFYAVDASFKFTYVNRKAEELWGRKRETLLGKHYWTEFPETVGSGIYVMHQKVAHEGVPVHYETLSPQLNKWIDASLYPNGPGGVSCYFRDISERKESEQTLRQTSERLRQALDAGRIFSWEMNPATRSLEWSANAAQVIGFPLLDNIDKTFELIHPNDVASTVAAINAAIESGEEYSSEYRLVNPANGDAQWLHSQGSIMAGAGGQPRFVGVTQNVTGRRLAQEALERQTRIFDTTLNSITDFAYIFGRNGRFMHSNRPLLELLGISQEEIVGKNFFELGYPDELAARLQQQIEEVLTHGRVVRDETPFISAEGIAGYYEYIFSPVFDKDGKVELVAGSTRDVTERRQNEEALRESEERLLLAASVTGFGIHDYDIVNGRIYWSPELKAMQGIPPDSEPTFEEILAAIHPDDRDRVEREMKGVLTFDGSGQFEQEFRILRRDNGEMLWLYNRSRTTFEGEGSARKPLRNVGIVLNITESKKAEQALRESEERLRITMESAIDYAIINVSNEGTIDGWSRGAERIFGWTEEEAIGHKTDVIFTPEDRAAGAAQKEMQVSLEEGMSPDERWHIRKDGSRFFMSGVMRPIDGDVRHGFVKVARDLTERQQAEEVLRVSEERYRIALQSAGMGAWDWNVPADEMTWNEQHYLMLGLAPQNEPQCASFFLGIVHPDDRSGVKAALTEAADKTGVYMAEFRIIRADNGEVRWMVGFGRSVMESEAGESTRMVGVMYDITNRKRVEEQKEEFIGVASHELRTPLTSIKAYAEVLQDMFEDIGDAHSVGLMQKMDGQIDRLTELIRALLDVTRIREGKLELRKESFDLYTLLREKAEELQRGATQQIEIVDDGDGAVTADRERIGQVVTNLLSNAIKYSAGAERIVLSTKREGDNIVVCVQDFGIGMSEAVRQRIFERFYRADDATVSTYPGLGLGLYITAEIVKGHNGRIWAESEAGKGSTFCFSLPA